MSAKTGNTLRLSNPRLFRSQAYINGVWVDADDGTTFEVNNPADGKVLTRVPDQGVAETRHAIEEFIELKYITMAGLQS
jgi:succinate-semialdehyde dehydrogenase/glutarate-semialdehyde dehydrogenase